MRGPRCLVALVLALAAFGCARTPAPQVAAAPPPSDLDSLMYSAPAPQPPLRGPAIAATPAVATPAAAPVVPVVVAPEAEPPYTLDSGDKLRIVVFGQDGLTNSYIVDAAGHITMPLIGSVTARGMTTDALSRAIAAKLRGGFIREPHVAIEVEAYRPFFILGEVTAPGQYPYVPNMTVETAVAIAGGYTPRAYRGGVRISRSLNGQIFRRGVPSTYPVRPGDTITVGERWF